MKLLPGSPQPLGATWDGAGTNFAVASEVAAAVELCLFDEQGGETRAALPAVTAGCWHGYLPGAGPGQRYGFRVHGPWSPDEGGRCLPEKLLLDPYARQIAGQMTSNPAVLSYHAGDPDGEPNRLDSAPFVPRSVVVDPRFDWGGDRPPQIPLHESVIYEMHVKGFTRRLADVPEELRGTYAGLGHPAAVAHLQRLGVTAVELLPTHQFIQDGGLGERGLRNYWGYNSIGFFAPHADYAAEGRQVEQFKEMVKALHQAGLEVLLDVVYNHTAEGNHLGPTLCFKGLDNAAYYRLVPAERRRYLDFTGTGNSWNARHPRALQLILDSLRYWVTEMHVDGFRFDLAATLARGEHGVDHQAPFFALVQQDPVVAGVKLIAEPWDVGEEGYQLGNFPAPWSEWNGRYRDSVRDLWRGERQSLGEVAARLAGSPDLYAGSGRRPTASINFVTVHDGFTLADLVSYDAKHNEANGEDNRDGASDNRSWNCGVEGPAAADPAVVALRLRQRRNFLATLLLSQGVPMLLGGDELGRTQGGNNNAYCQDNETSWLDWQAAGADQLLPFAVELMALRRKHPTFRRRRWLAQPKPPAAAAAAPPAVAWCKLDGSEHAEADFEGDFPGSLGVLLRGDGPDHGPDHGADSGAGAGAADGLADASFYLAFNATDQALPCRLPAETRAARWVLVLDTATGEVHADGGGAELAAGEETQVEARSLRVFRLAAAGAATGWR
jgi:isoamylase